MARAPVPTSNVPMSVVCPATIRTAVLPRVCPAADTMLTVLPRPDRPSAGAAKRAKGAGPQPGGGPSLVMVQTSGGGVSSAQLLSFTSLPPSPTCTVFTQTREPAAGCCPLMVAVPVTIPTTGVRSEEHTSVLQSLTKIVCCLLLV